MRGIVLKAGIDALDESLLILAASVDWRPLLLLVLAAAAHGQVSADEGGGEGGNGEL